MTGRITIKNPENQRAALLEEVVKRCTSAAEKFKLDIEIIMESDTYRFYLFERGLWTENRITGQGRNTHAAIVLSSKINEFSDLAYKGALYHSIGKVFGEKRITDRDPFLYMAINERVSEAQEAIFDYAMLAEGGEVSALVAWKKESSKIRADARTFTPEAFKLYCEVMRRRNCDLAKVIQEGVARYLQRTFAFDSRIYEH